MPILYFLHSFVLLIFGIFILEVCAGFIQTLESPEIKMLRFPGWKVLEKGRGPGKSWKSHGILK